MTRIQKISAYLLWIFKGLMIIDPLFIALQWMLINSAPKSLDSFLSFFGTIRTPEGWVDLRTVEWTPILKLLGFSADIIGSLPFIISLFLLKSLFSHYKNGEIFSVRNAIVFQKLGVLYLVDAVLVKSLSQTLMILAATFSNPPGHRYLSVSFGTPNLSSLFYGILVIIVSMVMLEASKVYEESKFTV